MENALSRRNFIGGALIAGAGMVGAAALSGCAGKAYAKQDTTGIKWDKEADVVIVGGGAAGLWAAVQAYDNNLSAIVLEKQPEESAGGDVRCCGGYLFPISTDPNVLMSTGSFGEANEDLVYGIDEYGTDAIDWLVAHKYMEWADQPYVVIDGAGPGIYTGLLQAAIDAEAEILYETPGLSLITSDEGEVVGVVAGTKDEPLNVKAHYGVLLATGAYTMNKELMANFHLMGMDYFSVGSPHLTGDGLIMAGELGAKLSKLAKGYEIMYLTSKAASKEIGTGMFCLPPDNGSVMIVNQNGDRFIDEFCSFTHNKSTLPLFDFEGDMMQCRADGAHYVNSSMFEIVDQATSPWVTPTLVAAGPTACPRRWAATSGARTTRPSSRRAGSCAARRWRTSPRPSASALRSCRPPSTSTMPIALPESMPLAATPRRWLLWAMALTTPSSLRLPLSTPSAV